MSASHIIHMQRCLELARLGKGYAAPNPMVGAILVHNGRVIGEGWHRQYGEAHAEVNCFNSIAEPNKHLIPDSTMYVSLEPCTHYGKTPPCALRIVQEQVKEVIICNTDPFEKVGGRGIEILRAKNIRVETGLLEKEGNWLNRRFFCFHQQQRPYIILKWAETANGFIAPADKSRFQLSNVHSSQLVHKWRTEEAAIIVGYNTAFNDNPQLTARNQTGRQPLRIALDPDLSLPQTHNLFNTDADTWLINEKTEETNNNISKLKMPFNENLLQEILNRLHTAGKTSLIVEGGAQLLQSFIDLGLWDEARVFATPKILQDGVAAPRLTNADGAASFGMDDDTLMLYVNTASAYTYVNGMDL
jgi:diaminohydroxyphosphoribosylaminopyrimidine deaminase / 5-amino-6-(5-phosphoribosylamino)uracil reductase